MNLEIIKRYNLPECDELLSNIKCRIHLFVDELDVLVHWYPDGVSVSGKKDYLGSYIQLEKLCQKLSKLNNCLCEDLLLQVIWKCGSNSENICQSFVKYKIGNVQYGFPILFSNEVLNRNNRKIKIIIKLYNNQNNEINSKELKPYDVTDNQEKEKIIQKEMKQKEMKQKEIKQKEMKNNLKKKIKVKKMKQITLKECYVRKAKIGPGITLIAHLLHRKNNKSITYFKESRIPANQVYDVLQKIAEKENHSDLFNHIPTIDIFAADDNHQRICKKYITKEMNFFDAKYDDINWRNECVWAFPELSTLFIDQTLKKFKLRHIKGFLCIPYLPNTYNWYWRIKTLKECKQFVEMKGRDKSKDKYIANKTEIDRCSFDIIVYYMNYQKY